MVIDIDGVERDPNDPKYIVAAQINQANIEGIMLGADLVPLAEWVIKHREEYASGLYREVLRLRKIRNSLINENKDLRKLLQEESDG